MAGNSAAATTEKVIVRTVEHDLPGFARGDALVRRASGHGRLFRRIALVEPFRMDLDDVERAQSQLKAADAISTARSTNKKKEKWQTIVLEEEKRNKKEFSFFFFVGH